MYTTVGLCFLGLLCVAHANYATPQNGTIRLVRPGDTTSNGPFSSGIVRVYYNGEWQSICSSDSSFNQNSADVVCHQLGYAEANSYSTAGNQNLGPVETVLTSEVSCSNSEYQVLFQCSYTQGEEECDSDSAVTVDCSNTRIWDDPFDGQVRLRGGSYSNDGVVEIYCNNEWGTVCSDTSFGNNEAEVICDQLGYNDYAYYSTSRNTSTPVWLNNVDCSGLDQCLSTCQACPTSDTSVSCTNDQIVNVVCSYEYGMSRNSRTVTTCDFTDIVNAIRNLVGIIVGVVIAVIVCCVIVALLPFLICCCLGVGVCAAASKA